MHKFLIIFTLLLSVTVCSEARQLKFDRKLEYGVVHYNYTWQNLKGEIFKTNFGLYANDVQKGMTEFKRFDASDLQNFSKPKISDFVKYRSPYGVNVSFDPKTDMLSFQSTRSRNKVDKKTIDKFMQDIEEEQQRLTGEYFKERYYNYNPKENSVRPAHGIIAKRYVTAMRPVARALQQEMNGKDSREITNHVLNFIQSIPYDTLEDVRTTNGAGFQTPYGVIHDNKGDCDSKSVMFAAIMRNLYPYARIIVVYVPGHALVGFDYTKGKNDYAIHVDGTTFVLAEPVGPNNSKLGQISPKALSVMRRGAYSFEEVPY
ncbi:MAG: hypothetical protein CMF61_01290 [Magnetococcales bacterium]|nr:hypothetical protein [Magnetococcales bacterium]